MNKRLRDLLAKVLVLRAGDIRAEMSMADVASWDSLKQMDLVTSLEQEYGIELALEDILRMTTLGNIAAVLAEKGVEVAD